MFECTSDCLAPEGPLEIFFLGCQNHSMLCHPTRTTSPRQRRDKGAYSIVMVDSPQQKHFGRGLGKPLFRSQTNLCLFCYLLLFLLDDNWCSSMCLKSAIILGIQDEISRHKSLFATGSHSQQTQFKLPITSWDFGKPDTFETWYFNTCWKTVHVSLMPQTLSLEPMFMGLGDLIFLGKFVWLTR